jgi:hypothetical protein
VLVVEVVEEVVEEVVVLSSNRHIFIKMIYSVKYELVSGLQSPP